MPLTSMETHRMLPTMKPSLLPVIDSFLTNPCQNSRIQPTNQALLLQRADPCCLATCGTHGLKEANKKDLTFQWGSSYSAICFFSKAMFSCLYTAVGFYNLNSQLLSSQNGANSVILYGVYHFNLDSILYTLITRDDRVIDGPFALSPSFQLLEALFSTSGV